MKKILLSLLILFCTRSAISQSWSLTGNSGTNPSNNFIGTTDNKKFNIRTNNAVRVSISSSGNIGVGVNSPSFKLDVKGGSINTDSLYRIRGNAVFSIPGNNNLCIGINAGKSINTGGLNTMVGYSAGLVNTTGARNSFFGYSAGFGNSEGNFNTAVGSDALISNNFGNYNTAIGAEALVNSTVDNNTAIGYSALYWNTVGLSNTAVGAEALYSNGTGAIQTWEGAYNTAVGWLSMRNNTKGSYNCVFGSGAMYSNTQGNVNAVFGTNAMYSSASGVQNSAFGTYAMQNSQNADYNSAFGSNTLIKCQGDYNTAAGIFAGSELTSGNYNTFLGYDANVNSPYNFSYSTAIGRSSRITASSQIRLGNSSVTSIGGYVNWSNISDGRYKKNIKENVVGLAFIKKLRPVTYNLDIHSINKKTNVKEEATDEKFITEKEKTVITGFIAQEVEKAAKELGYDFSGVDAPKNENDFYGLRYAEFVVPLVKAVQELSAANDELKKRLEKLETLLTTQSIANSSENIIQTNSFITVYPNPVKNVIYIQSKVNANFYLSDETGKSVIMKQIQSNGSIDVSKLSAGTYFLRNDVTGDAQKIVVQK